MMTGAELRERLALMAITDAHATGGRDLLEVVRAALAGGTTAIQLRQKEGTAREMVEMAVALRQETRRAGALLFVNDRIDIALAAEVDGAHIGEDDLPLEAARRLVPGGFLIGRSVDTAEQAVAAALAGADYVGLGPVFATPSKLDAAPAIGVPGVAAVRRATEIPIVAIGGIDEGNAEEIAAAGADGIAVIRAVMGAADPAEAARALWERVARGRTRRQE